MIIITKIPFSELLDISCFLSSQKLRGTLTTAFERHKILRTWINVRVNWINMMKSFLDIYDETKMGESALEIISCTKI